MTNYCANAYYYAAIIIAGLIVFAAICHDTGIV